MGGQRQREPKPDTCLACHTGSQTCHQQQLQLICAAAAEVEEEEGAEEGGEVAAVAPQLKLKLETRR